MKGTYPNVVFIVFAERTYKVRQQPVGRGSAYAAYFAVWKDAVYAVVPSAYPQFFKRILIDARYGTGSDDVVQLASSIEVEQSFSICSYPQIVLVVYK